MKNLEYDSNERAVEVRSFKQIRAGAIVSYASVFINMILGFVYTPWVLKMLGDGDYGLYSVSTSLIALFAIDFGLSAGVSRFVAKYRAEHDIESTNRVLGIVYKMYFVVTAVILAVMTVVFFYINDIYSSFTPDELHKFKIIYIITCITMLINIPFITLNGILNAYESFFALKICNLIQKLINVGLSIIVLLLGMGVYAYVVINGVSLVVVIIIKLILIQLKTPIKVDWWCNSREMAKKVFSFSMWSTLANIAQRFVFNIMPTILGMVTNTAAITHFALASSMEGYVFTFSDALNGMFLSKVSRIVAHGENGESNQGILPLMIKVGRINLSIVGLLVTGFIVLGMDFVNCWIGTEYRDVYYATVLLIATSIISHPQHIANTTILAKNKVKIQAIIMTVGSVINVVLSYTLSKRWGAVGAAASICFVFLFRTVCTNVVYYRTLNINIFKFFRECHLRLLPAMISAGLIGTAAAHFLNIPGWIGLFCEGAMFVLAYVAAFWFFGWNEFEKNLIKSNTIGIIKRFKRKK